jgi:hypothetical protein
MDRRQQARAIRAPPGFAVAILAYNVLHLLKHSVEQAHREKLLDPDASTYYVAIDLRAEYEGMLIALSATAWQSRSETDPRTIADRLIELAQRLNPRRLATHRRGPKVNKPKSPTRRSHGRDQKVFPFRTTCVPTAAGCSRCNERMLPSSMRTRTL